MGDNIIQDERHMLDAVEQIVNSAILKTNPRARELVILYLSHQNGHTPASGDEENGQHERGSQVRAVRAVLAAYKGRFTVGDIGDAIRATGTEMTNNAVGRVLLRLATTGELRKVTEGPGRNPNEYQKTRKLKSE